MEEFALAELFALAEDRTRALDQLVPGTEDYYYYRCLYHQHRGELAEVDRLLTGWEERHGDTERRQQLVHRQALLRYPDQPAEVREHIRYQLGLRFDHQREVEGQEAGYPSRLDPEWIGRDALARLAFDAHSALSGFTDHALPWLADRSLDDDRRRHLLARLRRPDHPRLVDLVEADLDHPGSGGFGSLPIHGLLLLEQLEALAARRPELLRVAAFVHTWLERLQPGPESSWETDPEQRAAHLDRLWRFVEPLAPVFNALKVHVLYHRLDHDRRQGVYDPDRFQRYLALPRRAHYVAPDYLRRREHREFAVALGEDFRAQTLLPPVRDDEPLVRDYLSHFLVDAASFDPYATTLRDDYLREVFATTKILAGVGDMEVHYSTLGDPARFQALEDRVDLELAPTNPLHFRADAPVTLDVYVKNVDTLVVKVFEINTLNHFLANGQDVDSTLDLDGLVATVETTHHYDEPPLRRVLRHFELPELVRPGVYVVELIGNGRSSRAVIRKGRLTPVERIGSAGHVFTVLDQDRRVVADAAIWLAGHEYRADSRGAIKVPFTTAPGRQQILLRSGDLTCLDSFYHRAESYRFTAGIYVDRERLIAGGQAEVVVRPSLSVHDTPVSLSLVEEPTLIIETTDRHDVSSRKEIAGFALHPDRESVHAFKVPEELARITFTVRGKVDSLTGHTEVELSASRSFALNQIDLSPHLEDLHLARTAAGYVLYLLGKSGEPRPGQPVNLSLRHRDFSFTLDTTLQTDDRGRIELGELPEIAQLHARSPSGVEESWPSAAIPQPRGNRPLADSGRCRYPGALHGRAEERITLPYLGTADRIDRRFSLLERRGDGYLRDRADHLALRDGLLEISGLPAGDYSLYLAEPEVDIEVRIGDGEPVAGRWLAGDLRCLETRPAPPLHIRAVDLDDDTIRVRLAHAGPDTRLHVAASRFVPAYSLFDELDRVPTREPALLDVSWPSSDYLSGRDIGDEYRYILERKYARKYPGVMLSRPGLLLNPWALRQTETGVAAAEEGGAYDRAAARARRAKKSRMRPEPQPAAGPAFFANLDFLPRPATLLLDLRPDDDGVVTIPRADVAGANQLRLIALDATTTVSRDLALPEVDMDHRDLRLALALDPALPCTEKRLITPLRAEQPLEVEDITTSRVDSYDSLARVYRLFATLSDDPTLAEFEFTMRWPELAPAEQQRLYSEYACHELSLFLARKDPAFFARVIRPYLADKRDQTFLDRYLLDADLTGYLEPWRFARLNAVERILLARRLPGRRDPGARHIRDLCDLLPPDIERDNHLFDTALGGSALDTGDAFGFAAEKEAALESKLMSAAIGSRGFAGGAPPPPPAAMPMPAAPQGMVPQPLMEECEEPPEADYALDQQEALDDLAARDEMRGFYQQVDRTSEWAENNYYHLHLEEQGPELIEVNRFWRDFAAHDDSGPFVSPHLADAVGNFAEMMLALAVLDLPFSAAAPAVDFAGVTMTYRAAGPTVVFHKEIMPATPATQKVPVLVSQNYFRRDDRYTWDGDEQIDKYVGDEFLIQVAYLTQVVLTNPTSTRQKLDLLLQIPRGAMPVDNGFVTRGLHVQLDPYATRSIEYGFYFPAEGEFSHYPVQVAKNQELIASAPATTLTVVRQPSRIDTESWAHVSQHGDDAAVLAHLGAANIERLDLDRIAWRMRERGFYDRAIALLRDRHVYHHTLWSYSLHHGDTENLRQFLLHEDGFLDRCGPYLESPLLVIDPVERGRYQHLEYEPLVNARTHRLGARHRILNRALAEQYRELLAVLCCRPRLTADDLLAATYYLLLQDRVEEGLATLARVDADQVGCRMQLDYLRCYAAFLDGRPGDARTVAERYRDTPVDRWRERFAAVLAQLDEAEGAQVVVVDPEDRTQRQTELGATEPSFDFTVADGAVTLTYQNLTECRVNYYPMDIELLFSRQPFARDQSEQFALIKPNRSDTVALPVAETHHRFKLPDPLADGNVIVEVVAAGQRRSQTYYAHQLEVRLIANYGQLQVTHSGDSRPLPGTYVKAYARMDDGEVRFYKDGYTDLRGRFDYAALSTDDLDRVERFSMLVLSDRFGAAIREADPPKR